MAEEGARRGADAVGDDEGRARGAPGDDEITFSQGLLTNDGVGYKYTKKADMDYSRQMIFCNEMDRPASSFIDAEKDKNPSAAIHTSIQTVANTQEFAITDGLAVIAD